MSQGCKGLNTTQSALSEVGEGSWAGAVLLSAKIQRGSEKGVTLQGGLSAPACSWALSVCLLAQPRVSAALL